MPGTWTSRSTSRLNRRAFIRGASGMGLVAALVGRSHRLALSQEATPERTAEASGFHLVARVAAEEWTALATATLAGDEALAGPELLAALRNGGFVIYFRHARTDFSQDDTDLSDLSNCATQRNLSAEGRTQARLIGDAIATLAIPIGDILSSELCRTRETAELAFGEATPAPDLTSFGTAGSEVEEEERVAALRRLLATPPAPGSNTVLVGHLFNIQAAAGISLAEGQAAIFRPFASSEAPATPLPTDS
ncbi:MAG: putative phosphohistidine phosphatase, SixA [Thermomicrobiales bacterium]|nr:putative phosphohistidine phosphatase, SixA [Thermomicrobiales bacterium]